MAISDIIEYQTEDAIPTNVVLANTPAWHETGTVLDTDGKKGLTIEQALKPSGLDFKVVKTPIYVPALTRSGSPRTKDDYPILTVQGQDDDGPRFQVDRQWGVVRTDTGYCLGVVGDTWEPFQPLDAFSLVDDLIQMAGGDHAWIESAGELDSGRKIWVQVHLDTNLQIAGEKYVSYLLFTTGFDGRLSNTAAAVDMRVVCANTLNYSLYGDAKQTGYVVRVRHTKNAAERVKEAAHILNLRNVRAEELAKQGEWLVEHSWDDGEFENFLETLMPIEEDAIGKPSGTMAMDRQDKVRKLYYEAPNLEPIRGTAWGGFQSVLEYADHGRRFTDADTQTKNQFGIINTKLKQNAYNLTYAFASSN